MHLSSHLSHWDTPRLTPALLACVTNPRPQVCGIGRPNGSKWTPLSPAAGRCYGSLMDSLCDMPKLTEIWLRRMFRALAIWSRERPGRGTC